MKIKAVHWSLLVALVVVIYIVIRIPSPIEYESKYEEYKKRNESLIRKLQQRDSLIIQYRHKGIKSQLKALGYKDELDSAMVQLKHLSKPVVTVQDRQEAREWINLHNSSLQE